MKRSISTLLCLTFLAGCTTVVHEITDAPIKPDPTKTSIGTDINDLKMDTFIGVNIKKGDPQLEDAHINVYVFNAVVLLTGEVPNQQLKTQAGDIARDYYGVRQVHNELKIGPNSSIVSRTNDSVITGHIKTKLLFEKNLDPTKVTVITEDNVVYLMGSIDRKTSNRAALIAASTRGVKKVVRVFEYID